MNDPTPQKRRLRFGLKLLLLMPLLVAIFFAGWYGRGMLVEVEIREQLREHITEHERMRVVAIMEAERLRAQIAKTEDENRKLRDRLTAAQADGSNSEVER